MARDFRSLLTNMAHDLNEGEVKRLVFLATGKESGLHCRSALDLFDKLEQRKLVSSENTSFLKSMLETIGRRDLSDMLTYSATCTDIVPADVATVYRAMDDLTKTEVDRLTFYFKVPQGTPINDAMDLALYLRKTERLGELSVGLRNVERTDLANIIDQRNDPVTGSTQMDDDNA